MGGQNTVTQEGNQNLASSVHPIYYYPTELLQWIFELAVEMSQEGFKTTTAISHVCQRWRDISLDMPRLWAYVGLSIMRDDSSKDEFLDRMRVRIRDLPAVISILDIISDTSTLRLNSSMFYGFSNIERLAFHLRNANSISALSNALYGLQENLSKGIEMIFMDSSDDDDNWRLNDIIEQTSPHRLFLCNPPTFFLSTSPKWRQIRSLNLRNVRKIHLIVTLRYFPGLESLEIIESTLLPPGSESILTLEHLKTFKFRNVNNMDSTLEKMSCPNLVTFDVAAHADADYVKLFFSRHSFVTIV